MGSPTNRLAWQTARFFPGVALLVIAGIFFLDNPLASAIEHFLRGNSLFSRRTAHIPDLLLPFVLTLSASFLAARHVRIRRFGEDTRCAFYLLGAIVLPASFLVKTILKPLFGRVETRVWLQDPLPPSLQWFLHGDGYAGFPSGHMMVFTALAAAFRIYFPRPGNALLFLLPLLGTALIVSNYHFLTDVVAGAYFGLAVTAIAVLLLDKNVIGQAQ